MEFVLLDSIPSQANRLEELLYRHREELGLPDILVEFSDGTRKSQWSLPHRVYDAYFRDSKLNGKLFFETEIGDAIGRGDPDALFKYSPHVLLFGGWNSHSQYATGHQDAARIERVWQAEIIGLKPVVVSRTSSRLDPTGIPGDAPITDEYKQHLKQLNEDLAKKKKFSEIGLGKVAPGLDDLDISIAEARHEILFIAAPWRRMGLSELKQEILLNLALLGLSLLYEEGIYLRSGTLFKPDEEPSFTDIEGKKISLPKPDELKAQLRSLLAQLPADERWPKEPLVLKPVKALDDAFLMGKKLKGGNGQTGA